MGTHCDCGAPFYCCHDVLHGSDGNCGFTTIHCSTFYIPGELIMGKNCFKLFLDDKIMVSE